MAAQVGGFLQMFARQSFDSLNRAAQSDSDIDEDRNKVWHDVLFDKFI